MSTEEKDKLEQIIQELSTLSTAVSDQSVQFSGFHDRLGRLESRRFEHEATADDDDTVLYAQSARPQAFLPNSRTNVPLGSVSPGDGEDIATEIEREYSFIKDSLIKVKLPNNLHVFDTKQGIVRDCQNTLSVISKCARYTETTLKQLSQCGGIGEENHARLYTILHAQTNFLQGEYAGLLVKSRFDSETSTLFKCLEKNSSALSGQALDNLKIAAEISAVKQRTDASHRPYQGQCYRGGYNSGFRGSRGNFNSGYRGFRGGYFPRRNYSRSPDVFDSFSGRPGFRNSSFESQEAP